MLNTPASPTSSTCGYDLQSMDDATTLTALVHDARSRFMRHFGRPATCTVAAPGRVNLIGEHTDYNDGFVLPIAIDRRVVIAADRSAAPIARVCSTADPAPARFAVEAGVGPGEPHWSNYVRGVVAGCCAAGLEPGGFDALVHADLPVGGGLSSSAALEVATAILLEALAGRPLEPVRRALLCQRAEHDHAGVPCGLMDQFIVNMARPGHAMLLDCRSRRPRHVPMGSDDVAVLIVDCGVRHELAEGTYARRRSECEEAARLLGVASLRDATIAALDAASDRLGPTLDRRARHVVTENDRTRRAADAIAASDWQAFGQLMHESHASLRDLYEVSCAELDLLVQLAGQGPAGAVYGARMTGGGFGGCTVNLVGAGHVDATRRYIREAYRAQTNIEAAMFVTRPVGGAHRLPG